MTDLAKRGDAAMATIDVPPSVILQQMVTSGADAASIATISALCERWEDRQAERAYTTAMNACQKELPAVTKDTFNKQTETWYAKLEKIAKTILATAHKHGFSLSFGTADCPRGETWIRFVLDVMHVGGCTKRYERDMPIDNVGPKGLPNKTVAHGAISSETIAKKLLLCGAFNVTLQGIEVATGTPPPEQTPEQEEEERKGFATIRDLLETRQVDMPKFWAAMGCDRIEDIPPARYKKVIQQLSAKPVKK